MDTLVLVLGLEYRDIGSIVAIQAVWVLGLVLPRGCRDLDTNVVIQL